MLLINQKKVLVDNFLQAKLIYKEIRVAQKLKHKTQSLLKTQTHLFKPKEINRYLCNKKNK